MELVSLVGRIDELDRCLDKCCESGCFHIEPAFSSVGTANGLTMLNEKNGYTAQLKTFERLAADLDIDLVQIALGCGYRKAIRIDNRDELNNLNNIIKDIEGPVFVEIRVRRGNRKDLGRPTTTPLDNKMALMDFLMKESSKK